MGAGERVEIKLLVSSCKDLHEHIKCESESSMIHFESLDYLRFDESIVHI